MTLTIKLGQDKLNTKEMERHTHNGVDSNFLREDLLYNKGTINGDVAVRRGINVKKVNWENFFDNSVIVNWSLRQDLKAGQSEVTSETWYKYRYFTWNDVAGYIKLSVWISDNNNKDDIEIKFYKNGSAISPTYQNGGSYLESTFENVAVTTGDTLEVWGRRTQTNSGRAYFDNFSLNYIKVFKENA